MSKILLIDIETFPALGYAWQAYDTNLLKIVEPTSICAWSAKWLGGKHVTRALPDYPGYKPGSRNDKKLMADLWKLLDEAEIVIAHNGDRFDVKKINYRFMVHGMTPPAPYRTIDTLTGLKGMASHDRNNLGEVCGLHGIGRKERTGGVDLWFDCLAGDERAWKRMRKYNAHDVRLLEGWYLKLRPWLKNHPNVFAGGLSCHRCGSTRLVPKGWRRSQTRIYQRFRCFDCKGWASSTKSVDKASITNAA